LAARLRRVGVPVGPANPPLPIFHPSGVKNNHVVAFLTDRGTPPGCQKKSYEHAFGFLPIVAPLRGAEIIWPRVSGG
jgi:hypothetical protein